ncbi:alpha/beta fold hydrolase [Candidatus Saccharibacteria bacterium]|nr:alpha/beta fold hydrolase [Candidatus Saccharibacteria bacterium]
MESTKSKFSQKTQKRAKAKSRAKLSWLLACAGLAVCVLAVGFMVRATTQSIAKEHGQLDEAQTSSGEILHASLDLRLAKKASYPSSTITLVKNLDSGDGLKRQIISFKVPDDKLTEYALLYLPDKPKPVTGWPVIILCHGYISPSLYDTTEGYTGDMEFYAQNGFAVIKPDFRGQGLSTGQGEATSAYYSMAYNTDVMSLISALKQTNYLDQNDINLWGHSMGAYIALRASVISNDIKNAILLSGPIGSLKQIYLSYVPPSDENNPAALQVRQAAFSKYGTPGEDTKFWQNASPTTFLNTSAVNFQIHVGLLDPLVPIQLSADLDDDLSALHHTHEYYTYADGGHSLLAPRQLIWSRSLALFKRS